MSANIFPMSKPKESRIPVPASPVPLRQSGSLRLKEEASNRPIPTKDRQRAANGHPQRQERQENGNSSLLRRVNSFMERGERRVRHGAQSVAVASRPLPTPSATESRYPNALKGPPTPQSPSRIRSLSLSLSNARLSAPSTRSPGTVTSSPRTPPTSPDARNNLDWDTESITSITSLTSVGSCDHASVARNGTTFSGRSMKYVFHCNQHAGATGEDYLTPTQRVHRQVKKLKYLLHQAKKDLDEKDSEILKLTKEVVELRLYKAALNSPEDQSNSSDAVTVKENNTDEQITPEIDVTDTSAVQNSEMTSSYSDSGHFDDYASSKDEDIKVSPFKRKPDVLTADKAVTAALGDNSEHINLIMEYEKRLQELIKTHEEESYQLKQKHNDKVEELLQRITDINKRYWELVPELDLAKDKIRELESQLEEACKKLDQQEEKQKQTSVDMYNQGHEAARLEQEARTMDMVCPGPSRISVPELLQELQVTKNELENIKAMHRQLMEAKNRSKIDPEITLQFLKSAVYYFLTDKENSQGHLKAIQSILGFTPNEISNIDKARLS